MIVFRSLYTCRHMSLSPYMDAPGLPGLQRLQHQVKSAPVHSDFFCGFSTVPDGMCWSVPQSLMRAHSARGTSGFANHGLTYLAINVDCLSNR